MPKKKYITPNLVSFNSLAQITADDRTCFCLIVYCPIYCTVNGYPHMVNYSTYAEDCPYTT